jgi:hypothetical protein
VPLADFGRPRPTPAKGVVDPNVDMKTPPRDQIDNLDGATFFKRLAALMKDNPPTASDAPMVATLSRLGIFGDFEFSKLPANVQQGLSRVPQVARTKIIANFAQQKQANGWMVSTAPGRYGTDYLSRALVAYIGVGGNAPDDAFYPIGLRDADGKPLNGTNRYVIHFAKADTPPVNSQGFWSLTVYDNEYFLVPNPANRYAVSSRDSFKRNQDGSMDLYVLKESPGANKESNWLPVPSSEFILMLRLYWPKDVAVNGAWVPPPVRRGTD